MITTSIGSDGPGADAFSHPFFEVDSDDMNEEGEFLIEMTMEI